MLPVAAANSMESSDATDDDYFLEIEDCFSRLRRTPFVFSGKDWALMKEWKDEGIPLPIVLEALEGCFSKSGEGKRGRVVSSLRYCRHAVRELWSERKDLYVGREAGVVESDPKSALEELGRTLEEAAAMAPVEVQAILRSSAMELLPLGHARGVPQIEEALLSLEDALFEQLEAALPADVRDSILRELDRQMMALPASADAAVVDRTRRANFKRLLRSRLQIPRLSLFS
jgi:hypothetical protein